MNSSSANTADCFNTLVEGKEVNTDMLREMKAYWSGLLVLYCIVNLSLAFLSCVGNALVILTVSVFSELHIVTNIGLANLATASFFHGSILHSFLFAVALNVLVDGCPLFQSSRSVVFFLSYVFLFNYIFNLCLVTAERLIGVVFPLRYHTIFPQERVIKLFAASWIASFLLSIPHSIDNSVAQSFGKATWILLIFFALTFLCYCNIRIFRIARRHRRQVMTQTEKLNQLTLSNQQRFRGAGTVFYVLVTLLVCFIPAVAIKFVLSSKDKGNLGTLAILRPWTSTIHVMYSGISPFVYFFRSRKLRRYSKKLLRKALSLMRHAVFSK